VKTEAQSETWPLGRAVAVHSLGWLTAANLVGLWLAVVLLWPGAGNWLAPLTFGRWSPLHLDWQLYGWCSLPLVGALLAWFLDGSRASASRDANRALGAWSLALAAGGAAWLGGNVSGKLFLDWHGWTRPLLPLAMLILWFVLAWHTRGRWRGLSRQERAARTIMLGVLLPVPVVLFWSLGRGMYQSVNPDSGGATGAAVLGSSLGVISLFMLLPTLIGLRAERRVTPWICWLGASWLVFGLTDRGNVSHHAWTQIAALAVLLAWVPLLPMYWRRFAWGDGSSRWLGAAAIWWGLLTVTGWISFLPGFSESLKFTHALVAHAHLAMAGFVTSVNAATLVVLTRRPAPRGVWWLWQAGCVVYVVSMLLLGAAETTRQAELFRSESWSNLLLAARLGGGAAMTAASCRWLAASVFP
jgi:cytochrome c oxidase cbb3-type subunit I